MRITDSLNQVFLSMDRNQWTCDTTIIDDIKATARGNRLKIISKFEKTNFEIIFQATPINDLVKKLAKSNYNNMIINNIQELVKKEFSEDITLCTLLGEFYLPQHVTINEDSFTIENPTTLETQITITGSFIGNCSSAIEIN